MSFATRRETRLTIAKLIHLMLHSQREKIVSVPVFRTQFIQSVSSPRTPVPSEHIRFSRLISSWFGSVSFKFLEDERKKSLERLTALLGANGLSWSCPRQVKIISCGSCQKVSPSGELGEERQAGWRKPAVLSLSPLFFLLSSVASWNPSNWFRANQAGRYAFLISKHFKINFILWTACVFFFFLLLQTELMRISVRETLKAKE